MAGEQILDPSDLSLQMRVQGSFWIKLQRSEVTDPESNYRLLAINILETAKSKGYSASDMERACKRFESKPQYGDRIEIANFFDDEAEKLYPYSWCQKLHAEGKYKWSDFDGYRIEKGQPLKWRLHDDKKISNLECVVWAGRNIEPPKPTQCADEGVKNPTKSKDVGKNDYISVWYVKQISTLHLKVYELEEKLKKAERKNGEYESTIEKLQMQTGQKDWMKAVNRVQE